RPLRPVRAAIIALLAWPIGTVAFGLTAPTALVLALAVAWGSGFALFDIWWGTAMAERVPPAALSRVSSYDWLGSLIFTPVGFLLAGPLAEASSPQTVLVTGGLLATAVLALALLPRSTRRLRRVDP